jgi:hypothetical protein
MGKKFVIVGAGGKLLVDIIIVKYPWSTKSYTEIVI